MKEVHSKSQEELEKFRLQASAKNIEDGDLLERSVEGTYIILKISRCLHVHTCIHILSIFEVHVIPDRTRLHIAQG